jgi:hypothetical protein
VKNLTENIDKLQSRVISLVKLNADVIADYTKSAAKFDELWKKPPMPGSSRAADTKNILHPLD